MIIESPIPENYQRNIIFSNILWLNKEEYLKNKTNPNIAFPYAKNSITNEKYLVGKNYLNLSSDTKNVFIGYVNVEESKLKIATNDKKLITTDEYYILALIDHNSYFWTETKSYFTPNYALRACLNYNLFEYFYIGRTLSTASPLIGNVCRSDGLLYVYNDNNEAQEFENYEILCLKPSPATLKQLCRGRIRLLMSESNFKIAGLNTFIPQSLVDYIKYPSYLSDGDCLLKNEKLVSNNGLHELKLTSNSKLVYQPSISIGLTKRILYDFVDSIWVKKYFSVINRYDNAFVYFLYLLTSYDVDNNSRHEETPKLKLTDDGQLILQQADCIYKKYFLHDEYCK